MRRRDFATLLLVVLCSCGGPPNAPQGGGPLPPPPASDDYISATSAPFARSNGENAFARTVARLPGPNRTTVEVRDVIVGPKGEATFASLPGPMLVDLRSGAGSLVLGERTQKLTSESAASVPAGTRPVLRNEGTVPLVLRLYLVEGS